VSESHVRAEGGAEPAAARRFRPALLLGALGVVYGDIGTSPLYAYKEAVRAASGGGNADPIAVVGAVSLILWALILIVSLKYAVLILRADNAGEGALSRCWRCWAPAMRSRAHGRRCCSSSG
jgi:KUP system potassium uptake protein